MFSGILSPQGETAATLDASMRGNILSQNIKFYGSGQHPSCSFKEEVGVYLTASVLQIAATYLVQKSAEAKTVYHDLDQKEC